MKKKFNLSVSAMIRNVLRQVIFILGLDASAGKKAGNKPFKQWSRAKVNLLDDHFIASQLHAWRVLGTSNGESKASFVSNVWCLCLCPSTSSVVKRNKNNPNNAILNPELSGSYRNNGLKNDFWKQLLARQCQILETSVSFQLFGRKGSCSSGEGKGNIKW